MGKIANMAKAVEDANAAILEAHAAKAARAAELKAKRDDERAKREGETKADAFKRIGVRRMNMVLDDMAKVEQLSNAATYEYTDEQVKNLIGALQAGLEKIATAFANKGVAKNKGGFSL